MATTSRSTSSPAMLKPSLNSVCGLMRAVSPSPLASSKVVMERSAVLPPISMEAMRMHGWLAQASRGLPMRRNMVRVAVLLDRKLVVEQHKLRATGFVPVAAHLRALA